MNPPRVYEGPTSLHLARGAEWAWIGLASEDGLNRLRMDLLEALDRLCIDLRWSGVRRICLSDAGWMATEGRALPNREAGGSGVDIVRKAIRRPFPAQRQIDRNLSAGADLNEVAGLNVALADAFARRGQRVMEHLLWPGWRSLTLISGASMGGGCDLAMSGQERWGVEGLKLAHPAAMHGILTGFGGTVRLVEVLGEQGADRLFRGLERWGALEAFEAGAIQRRLSPEGAHDAVTSFLEPALAPCAKVV